MPPMIQPPHSATEAIRILKAELLSPNWALSPQRNGQCTDAMNVLNLYFDNRRYSKGIVAIARQLLIHLAQETKPRRHAVDLLKEIMAHTVTMFEGEHNESQDKKICASCLRRFKLLKIFIQKTTPTPNKFTLACLSLKHEVETLQCASTQFLSLSPSQQIETMLTIQSLIAETRGMQKKITTPPKK